jgi:hypothetical protein
MGHNNHPSAPAVDDWQVLWRWWDEGVLNNARYMLIVRDKWTGNYYPVYSSVLMFHHYFRMHNNNISSNVMEIYDISQGRMKQLTERRAWNGPQPVHGGKAPWSKQRAPEKVV